MAGHLSTWSHIAVTHDFLTQVLLPIPGVSQLPFSQVRIDRTDHPQWNKISQLDT